MERRFDKHVYLIQTDGGPEFKADFITALPMYCDQHRIARPYRKNKQSYIESFNRTVRKERLGWNTYRTDELQEYTGLVESFLTRYHYHRPHLGLGMRTPSIMLLIGGKTVGYLRRIERPIDKCPVMAYTFV